VDDEAVIIRTARGAGALSAQSIITSLMGTAFFMMMARILSKAEMGIYNAVFLISTILSVASLLGMDFATMRYISYYNGKNDPLNKALTYRIVFTVAGLSACVVAGTLAAISVPLSEFLFGTREYAFYILIAAILVLTNAISLLLLNVLFGLQKYYHAAAYRVVAQGIRITISVMLLLWGLGILAVLMGWMAFYLVLIFASLPIFIDDFLGLKRHIQNVSSDPEVSVGKILHFSLPIVSYQVIVMLTSSLDQFILLKLANAQALGSYTVAVTAASIVSIIMVTPIVSTLLPGFSETMGRIGEEQVISSLKLATRYINLVFIPSCIGIAILSPPLVILLGGSKYLDAALPLTIISLGAITCGTSAAIAAAFLATGRTSDVFVAYITGSGIEMVSTMIFVPIWGTTGAALGRALMFTTIFAILMVLCLKRLRGAIDTRTSMKSLIASAVMTPAVYVIAVMTGYQLMMLPLYLLVGVCSYALPLLLMRTIEFSDIEFFCKVVPMGRIFLAIFEKYYYGNSAVSRILRKFIPR